VGVNIGLPGLAVGKHTSTTLPNSSAIVSYIKPVKNAAKGVTFLYARAVFLCTIPLQHSP
jgi:hypothetical protein